MLPVTALNRTSDDDEALCGDLSPIPTEGAARFKARIGLGSPHRAFLLSARDRQGALAAGVFCGGAARKDVRRRERSGKAGR